MDCIWGIPLSLYKEDSSFSHKFNGGWVFTGYLLTVQVLADRKALGWKNCYEMELTILSHEVNDVG